MRKADLINKVSREAEISKKAAASVLDSLVGAIHESLKEKKGHIRIFELGTFKVARRKARTIVHPQSGRKIKVSAGYVARFVPSQALRFSAKGSGAAKPETCEDIGGTLERMVCKLCGSPALRTTLPFCRDHAPQP